MNPVHIYCRNIEKEVLCAPGTTLAQLALQLALHPSTPWLTALVDYRLKDLAFEIYKPYTVKFIDLSHPDGVRTYVRSLSFLLQKAVYDLYPQKKMILDYSVANGLYGVLDTENPKACTPQEIAAIIQRMRELVDMKIPFFRARKPVEEAIELFTSMGKTQKALLLKTRQSFYASIYYLAGYPDSYFGPLVPDTSVLQVFSLIPFHQGFLLQYPVCQTIRKVNDGRSTHDDHRSTGVGGIAEAGRGRRSFRHSRRDDSAAL